MYVFVEFMIMIAIYVMSIPWSTGGPLAARTLAVRASWTFAFAALVQGTGQLWAARRLLTLLSGSAGAADELSLRGGSCG